MTPEAVIAKLRRSIRVHIITSYLCIFGLFGSVIAWASYMEISGAVIASGSFVVESNSKKIQHPDGGVVRRIAVRNGDVVKTGHLLVELDDSLIKANLEVAKNNLYERLAERARLMAELGDEERISFPETLRNLKHDSRVDTILSQQQTLMTARQRIRQRQKEQLDEQIAQLRTQIAGMTAQSSSRAHESKLLSKQVESLQTLFDQRLTSSDRLIFAQREEVRMDGLLTATNSEIARLRQQISERRIQVIRITEEARAEMLERLQTVRAEIVQLTAEKIQNQNLLSRVIIRAPQAGVIHNVAVHTVGGVVQAAETVLEIIPIGDDLVMDLSARPVDVDQVFPGQTVSVQLPGFSIRDTPRLIGLVETVSADLVHDAATNQSFYTVRVRLGPDEQAKLNGEQLVPGMPVIGFIETKRRTVLTYLMEPILNQVQLALKEE